MIAEKNEAINTKDAVIAEAKPKAEYHDKVLTSTVAMSVTTIAKEYGMSAVKFNKLLNKLDVQYNTGGQWVLYQQYADMGYTDTKTTTYTHKDGTIGTSVLTKWTQKGRHFLYDFLKERNIVPVVETQTTTND